MSATEEILDRALTAFQIGDKYRRNCSIALEFFQKGLDLMEQAELLGSLPLEALRWRLSALGDAGSMAKQIGVFSEARIYYRAQMSVIEQIHAQTGDLSEANRLLQELSGNLRGVGFIAWIKGDLAEAKGAYGTFYRFAEQMRCRNGDSLESLRDVSDALNGLATVAEAQGEFPEAQKHLEARLQIVQQIQLLEGDTERTIAELHQCRLSLGLAVEQQGRLTEAMPNYKLALHYAKQMLAVFVDTAMAMRKICECHKCLGDLAGDLGFIEDAQLHYQEMYDVAERIRATTGDTPRALIRVLTALSSLGDIAQAKGQNVAAKKHFATALELAQQAHRQATQQLDQYGHVFPADQVKLRSYASGTTRALEVVIGCVSRLGCLSMVCGDFDEAMANFEAELQLVQELRSLQGNTPSSLVREGVCTGRLGDAYHEMGDFARSAQYYLASAELICQATAPRAELTLRNFGATTWRLARVAATGHLRWSDISPFYGRMLATVLDYFDFNRAESVERARLHANRFHRAWLGLALTLSPADIPNVIGAAHGRKLSQLALDELQYHEDLEAINQVPAFKAFFEARRRVQALYIRLGENRRERREIGDWIFKEDSVPSGGTQTQLELAKAQKADLDAALATYERARKELVAIRRDLANIEPANPCRYSLETLQAGLGPDSALLLLIDAPTDEARLHRAHALFIPKSGDPVLKPLPELDALPAQLHAYRSSLNRGDRSGAYRDCSGWTRAVAGEGADAAVTPIDAATALKERLWSAFKPELQPEFVKHLHVVSHGNLHNLPLSLGAPSGLRVSQYPGLVYYWMVHNRDAGAIVVDTSRPLSAKVYTPQTLATEGLLKGMAPIPHVLTEYALAASCWLKMDEMYECLDGPPATLMHIACHGTLKREGQEDPCLILGPGKALNLLELLNGEKSSPVVYLSACLVGQTKEDVDGDPLGLVGAFMIRGAKVVIAALNPINDFWAPLLAYLFHRTLQSQSQYEGQLAPVEALEDAKRQVMTGEWVPGCVPKAMRDAWMEQSKTALQAEYTNSMATQLRHWEGEGLPLCWGEFSKGLAALMKPLEGLPEVPTTADVGRCPLFAALDREANQKKYGRAKTDRTHPIPPDLAQTLAGLVAKQVVDSRTALHRELISVRLLLQDMQAFGAVARN